MVLMLVFPITFEHSGQRGPNIAQTVVLPVITTFGEVLCATLYFQLRVAKEGVGVDKLANVFG